MRQDVGPCMCINEVPKLQGFGDGNIFKKKKIKEMMARIFPNLKKTVSTKFRASQHILNKET